MYYAEKKRKIAAAPSFLGEGLLALLTLLRVKGVARATLVALLPKQRRNDERGEYGDNAEHHSEINARTQMQPLRSLRKVEIRANSILDFIA